MKFFLPVLIITIFIFSFFAGGISAQETELEIAEKYSVSFPIEELGNCKNMGECRSFCDDPVNSSLCIDYAKTKGFYNEEEVDENKNSAIKTAKGELGCDSEVSCRNLCEQPANYSRCSQFARRHNLEGGVIQNTASTEVVKKAQEILGCNSETSCKSFCEKDGNKVKCGEFAKTVGLRGGETRVGPGGCITEETCRAFCSSPDNYRICQNYAGARGGDFSGPGGCNSEESCKKYCEENPSACGYKGNNYQSGQYNPVDMCNRTQGCFWGNNTCNCSSNYESTQTDPAKECVKYSGCTWSGTSCRCSTPIYTSNYSYNPEEHKASCISGGCNWNGSSCDCSGSNGPAIQCGNKGCSWINSSCQCSTNSAPSSTSTSGSGSYSEGSSMSREQQEYYCKAGGGSCDWSSGYCYCKGYTSPYSTPSTSTTNTTNTTSSGGTSTTTSTPTSTSTYTSPSSAPTGMTRESQQAGCTSCGGTCTWNGDFCNCQCASTQTSTPPPPPPPPPAYVDPYEQCIQSGGSWAGGQCYSGGVQGASVAAGFWEWVLSLFR